MAFKWHQNDVQKDLQKAPNCRQKEYNDTEFEKLVYVTNPRTEIRTYIRFGELFMWLIELPVIPYV